MTSTTGQTLSFRRDTHLFAAQPALVQKLRLDRKRIQLAPDQLLHPLTPMAYIVRLGKLRVTQFLPDGSEVTRAVLQAGTMLTTADSLTREADPARDVYHLADMVLMALGEVELWALPPEALEHI